MNSKRIYYLVYDCGDGSTSVHFFHHVENADKLVNEESDEWDEDYNTNEGLVSSFDVFGTVSGIDFQDEE